MTRPTPKAAPREDPTTPWHALGREASLAKLQATDTGLTADEATRRREKWGPNALPQRKREGPLVLLWRQINNPLIWVLLGAGAVAMAVGKVTDGAIVLAVVVLNTLLGFFQELKAVRAIDSLREMVPEEATVLRDGKAQKLPALELVPGDMVQLASGDRVPADLRLLEVKNLGIEEAALTGESVPATKTLEQVEADAVIGDRTNLAFSGTVVTSGGARGVVVETGARTELGRISGLLDETVELQTPLTKQLTVLGRYITFAIVAVSVVLLPIGVLRGYSWIDAMLVAITLAVAAIPEGLPAIVTIALSIGVRRMAERRAIIRQLPAVETLGSTTVICTDKTGTLTRNEMTVQALWTPDGHFALSGVGYGAAGKLTRRASKQEVTETVPAIERLALAAALCNDATVQPDTFEISGDPTEAALVVAARKLGIDPDAVREKFPRLDVIPFESEHQYMATLHALSEGSRHVLLKGAPEVVLDLCGHAPQEEVEALAREGMRVLALAWKTVPEELDCLDPSLVAQGGFELLGLEGMIDPPREEAVAAVRACREAGIDVKMITGDHPLTAEAIGGELGLGNGHEPAITGKQLQATSDEALPELAAKHHVFARVAPEHKLRLVRALQKLGNVVAMTGDGVNDAPALKQANIGVSMGITGTAVAKEAADVVLTDDNFASIEAAVEEGRRVYDNLIKSFAFVLPANLGLALILMVAVAFFPIVIVAGEAAPLLPMLPRQILWINLVASVALSLPLAFEVAELDTMRRRPRPPSQSIFTAFLIGRTVATAVLMTAGGIGLFLWRYDGAESLREAQTMAVTTVVAFQIFYMVMCRTLRTSVWRLGLFSNPTVFLGIGALVVLQAGFIYFPPMQRLFDTRALEPLELLLCLAAGATIIPIIAVEKAVLNRVRRTRRDGQTRAATPGHGRGRGVHTPREA